MCTRENIVSQEDIASQILDCLSETGIELKYDTKEEVQNLDIREFLEESLDFINFIVSLEEKIGMELPDEFLAFDAITTVKLMAEYIVDLLFKGAKNYDSF